VKQELIFGYLPTTMQPTALWSISTDCARARAGLTNRRALPMTAARLDEQVMGPPMLSP
jgi:hypothetical protein